LLTRWGNINLSSNTAPWNSKK